MYGFFLNTLDPTVIDPDIGQRLNLATSTLLRGMLTVFAVLTIIWLFVSLLRVFLHDLPKKRVADKKPATQAQTPAPVAVTPAPVADAELIAAITAAIAAYAAEEGDFGFRVVSFHRVNQ